MLEYDFGPQHPFRPERLARCVELVSRFGLETADPGPATEADARLVHPAEFLDALRLGERLTRRESLSAAEVQLLDRHGLLSSDNPPFPGMFPATLNFMGGTITGARSVRDGAATAITLGGGLHHCSRERASGFCLMDDPAIACAILRERFDRVAYVDIDLHHGDGVQWIWYDDPSVLTCSIHESGRTLFPGTGFSDETGAQFTALNVPLEPHTTGDVWLDAFERGILPALDNFQPEAIVLQMGSDAHFSDPLGHLDVSFQHWLRAVEHVKALGLPFVACGGGGYNMNSVVRMWSAAAMTLADVPFENRIPDDLAAAWNMAAFTDEATPTGRGAAAAEQAIAYIREHHLPGMPQP